MYWFSLDQTKKMVAEQPDTKVFWGEKKDKSSKICIKSLWLEDSCEGDQIRINSSILLELINDKILIFQDGSKAIHFGTMTRSTGSGLTKETSTLDL